MAHVLCFFTSPRKSGNSASAAQDVLLTLHEAGHTSESIHLCTHHVRPCIACDACHAPPYGCPLDAGDGISKDDAYHLLESLRTADVLLLASPVYFYGPPAVFKALIDRSQRYWAQSQSQPVVPKLKPAFVILTAAHLKGEKLFDASLLIVRSFMSFMGFTVRDTACLRDLDDRLAYKHTLAARKQIQSSGALWASLI